MKRRCPECGRGATRGASRSHSNIRSLKRQHINLQKVNGVLKCTRCIRSSTRKTIAA